MVASFHRDGTHGSRTRAGLIAIIALRQAQAIRERRAREQAEKSARADEAKADPRPKKRGWFR